MSSGPEIPVLADAHTHDHSHSHAHEHGLPHSHGGPGLRTVTASTDAGTLANPPTMSLLRLSLQTRLAAAILFAAIIWAASHWAMT
jgi:hypothetical protein